MRRIRRAKLTFRAILLMLILAAVAVINWPGDKQARATAAQVKALLRSVSPQNNFSTNEQRAVFGLVQMGRSALS
jgi:hypothetical protein